MSCIASGSFSSGPLASDGLGLPDGPELELMLNMRCGDVDRELNDKVMVGYFTSITNTPIPHHIEAAA